MPKSTTETVLDAIRVVNGLDRKGRLHVFRYLYKEFSDVPNQAEIKRERKKKATKEEETRT